MNRFHILSVLLHAAILSAVFISGRAQLRAIPAVEIYKVSLAPLPQPRVISPEEPAEETREIVPEEKPEEKAPPKKEEKKPEAVKKPAEKKAEEVVKTGLPDIKPKVYTGSGRGFTYSYYLNILLNRISKNWHNPFRDQDVILKSVVYFEVDKDGTIYGVRLEETSGNDIYNETAMRAVIVTKSLPPLPDEFVDDYLKIHLEFLTAR